MHNLKKSKLISTNHLPGKLQDDIRNLVEIAYTHGSLKSSTIIHWLNEKGIPEAYTSAVDYLQKHNVLIIEDDDTGTFPTQGILDSNKILIQQKPLSIEGILKRIKYSEINLDTEFQRKRSLWDGRQKANL